jgi:hypothetical protein
VSRFSTLDKSRFGTVPTSPCCETHSPRSAPATVASGFFGMLFDWHELGVAIRLYTPQPRVANMLWFRQFFNSDTPGAYLLQSEPKEMLAFDDSCDWNEDEEEVWVEGPSPSVGAYGNT